MFRFSDVNGSQISNTLDAITLLDIPSVVENEYPKEIKVSSKTCPNEVLRIYKVYFNKQVVWLEEIEKKLEKKVKKSHYEKLTFSKNSSIKIFSETTHFFFYIKTLKKIYKKSIKLINNIANNIAEKKQFLQKDAIKNRVSQYKRVIDHSKLTLKQSLQERAEKKVVKSLKNWLDDKIFYIDLSVNPYTLFLEKRHKIKPSNNIQLVEAKVHEIIDDPILVSLPVVKEDKLAKFQIEDVEIESEYALKNISIVSCQKKEPLENSFEANSSIYFNHELTLSLENTLFSSTEILSDLSSEISAEEKMIEQEIKRFTHLVKELADIQEILLGMGDEIKSFRIMSNYQYPQKVEKSLLSDTKQKVFLNSKDDNVEFTKKKLKDTIEIHKKCIQLLETILEEVKSSNEPSKVVFNNYQFLCSPSEKNSIFLYKKLVFQVLKKWLTGAAEEYDSHFTFFELDNIQYMNEFEFHHNVDLHAAIAADIEEKNNRCADTNSQSQNMQNSFLTHLQNLKIDEEQNSSLSSGYADVHNEIIDESEDIDSNRIVNNAQILDKDHTDEEMYFTRMISYCKDLCFLRKIQLENLQKRIEIAIDLKLPFILTKNNDKIFTYSSDADSQALNNLIQNKKSSYAQVEMRIKELIEETDCSISLKQKILDFTRSESATQIDAQLKEIVGTFLFYEFDELKDPNIDPYDIDFMFID